MKQKKIHNGRLKKLSFSKPPILNIFPKNYRVKLDQIGSNWIKMDQPGSNQLIFFFLAFVCDPGANVAYLSGCHAGCQTMTNDIFTNCSCSQSTIVNAGLCPSQCSHVSLSVMIFLQVFFTFMGTMPGLVAGLRYVLQCSKSKQALIFCKSFQV